MIVFVVALLLPQFGINQKASAAESSGSTNGNYALKVQTTGGHQWDGAQIDTGASGLNLVAGTTYTFSYDLYTPDQDVAGIVLQTNGNYNWIKNTGALSAASPGWTSYTANYTYLAASGAQIQFVKIGDSGVTDAKNITYYIDNFVVKDASDNVVYKADFDDQTAGGFIKSGDATLTTVVTDYFLKVQTTGGHQWDGAQIATGASGLNLEDGKTYTFSYDLYTPDQDVAGILLQTSGYNWIKNSGALSAASPAWNSYSATYTYTAATSGSYIQFVKTGDSGATDAKNITYYIDNFIVKDASDNVVYKADFDDKAADGFTKSADATLTIVNSMSAVTTPTINPDVLSLQSIKNTYPDYLMGNIIGPYYMHDPIMPVLKAQFGVVTPENAMKPASLIGTSASTHDVADLNFTEADTELQSAIDNGLKVHGHTLVWEGQSIPWLNNAKISDSDSTPSNPGLTADGAYANMNAYINTVLKHFDGKFNASTQNIISWDVVNEAMGGSVRDSSLSPTDWHSYLKSTPWLKATDANYVEQAFKYARAAEPDYNVLLYYNDYSMDDQNKAAAVRDMVKDINSRWAADHPGKQLIQGVGMQEHNGLGTNPNNTRKSIQMFKDIGVKVSISELDISAGTDGTQTADQKTAQAAQYARLMQVYTDPAFKDTVQRITLWGLTDTNSWLASGSPLLFDGNLYPKEAFNAVIDPAGYLANYHAPTKPAGGKTTTAAKGTPTIDGNMDGIWNTATPIDINVTQAGNTKADTHMPVATARVLWDNANLYVIAQVTKDPTEPLDKGNANPWEQDSVEVVVDLTNGSSAMYSNASGHYRVRYDGFASVDAAMTDNQGIATKMTSATTYDETTNSYTVEMKIPFIQITPEIGTQIGFDVQVNDAKAGARIGAFAWNDATGTAYQDLFKIGTLQFAAAGSITSPPSGGTPSQGSSITVDKNHITAKAQPDSNGTASVTISASDLHQGVSQSTDKSVTIQVQHAAGVKEVQVNLPTDQVLALSDQIQSIAIDTGLATVSIDPNLLKHSGASGTGNVQLSVSVVDPASLPDAARSQVGGNTVYNFNLSVNGTKITKFTGNDVKVSMDYTLKPGENPNNVVIYYIDDNGKLEIVKNGKYNMATGKIQFTPKHFSKYVAKVNGSTFKDVNDVPWAVESIQALEARGIVAGVKTGTFAPNNQVTRAEFIQMLMNAIDPNSDKATSTFTDVKEGAWYYQAIASAQQLGIVNGKADGSYGINDAISRQEMAAMLYRAAAKANVKLPNTVNELKFADDSSISDYAAQAIKALQQAGIVNGMEDGKFAPASNATRAQAAVIIYGLFKLL
ncbi:endo-1,4-beta-xylanase [Paenibacillus sp. ATY16]|uniref:endo-1,4-beta-xylanase n=1 Tax=Paenibacillus sp. ATY16 TaxID=1759312 RepID=UPI002010542A|nr:endo-1,4-beta-xylanase [Paenibacillus sp. ATY16]MCK9857505.1 endo-1,4-beta-xylanase [Paenibacillus sp. ATY16]